jgi:hypothetical protein
MFVKNKKLKPKQEKVQENKDNEHPKEHIHRHRNFFTEYM